jgi:hypothetical protein
MSAHNISPYQPNSQDTSRYSIVPFQIFELNLTADRSQGEYFPQLEGEGFYVEAADYPALCSIVAQGAPVRQQTIALRDGAIFSSPFKGLMIAHPPLPIPAFGILTLRLVIFKAKNAFENQCATPRTRLPMAMRNKVNTGVQQTSRIFVPPGVRQLDFLFVSLAGATCTEFNLSAQLGDGTALVSPTTITQRMPDTGTTVSYLQTISKVVRPVVAPVLFNNRFQVQFGPMVLPANCVELEVAVTGTGLTPIDQVDGAFS